MKRLIVVALLMPAVMSAQQIRDSVISVSANRTSTVIPDRVSAFVVVEGTGETPADANARLDVKLRAVNDAIRALGTFAATDRPVSYGVSLAQNPGGYPTPAVPTTYMSRSVIRLHLSRLDQMANAMAAILGAGATSVSSLQFEASAVDSIRREKISEAIAIARADAQALATALGGKLGGLVDVSSSSAPFNQFGPGTQIVFDQRYGSSNAQSPVVMVNTNVSMRFRLVR